MSATGQFTKLVNGSQQAALVCDADGQVSASNDAAQPLVDALNAADAFGTTLRAMIGMAAANETPQSANESLPTGDTQHTFELNVVPIGDGHILVLARDKKAEQTLQAALIDSRQRYKDLVEVVSEFAWEVDCDARFVFVSPQGALGLTANELIGKRPSELGERLKADLPPGEIDLLFHSLEPVNAYEFWVTNAENIAMCLQLSSLPVIGEDGTFRGNRGLCRNVTKARQRDLALVQAYNRERLLNRIISSMSEELEPEAIMTAAATATALALGADGCHIYRLDSAASPAGKTGSKLELIASYGEHGPKTDLPIIDGFATNPSSVRWKDDKANHIIHPTSHRGAINGAVSIWRKMERGGWSDDDRQLIEDVVTHLGITNEQLVNHERIVRLSRTDGLTGLLNRRAFFEEEIPRRFERAARSTQQSALIYVDLDNFKLTNDTFGHLVGDKVLINMASILERMSRPGDAVARLGGDEFAFWMDGVNQATAEKRAAKILATSGEFVKYSSSDSRPLGVSLGIAIYRPETGEKLDELLTRADMAMYRSKEKGKNSFTIAPEAGDT